MRKQRLALLLVILGAAAIAAAISCSGPMGPTGDSVTGPPGSPGPTGVTGQQGPTGSIGGLPPNSLYKHVVIEATNGSVSVSWDMLQIGGDFFGATSTGTLSNLHGIPGNSWAEVVALSLTTASTEVGLTDTLADVPTHRAERQIGWAWLNGTGTATSFRQVDHEVRYLKTASMPLLSGVGAVGTFTKIPATKVQQDVPPGVRHVSVRSHVFIPTANSPQEDDFTWSMDGTTATGTVVGRCSTGSQNVLNSMTDVQADCTSEATLVLDPAQELFYKLGAGANGQVDLDVVGYVDETL